MRNRFQSLPVDNDVYKLLSNEANKLADSRTNVMNRILRRHFKLDIVEVAEQPKQLKESKAALKRHVNEKLDEIERLGELAMKGRL